MPTPFEPAARHSLAKGDSPRSARLVNDVIIGRKLEKTYPGGVRAVDGVDVAIASGAVTALVGNNGAGKTTLLRMLAGELAPSSGEVELLGLRQPSLRGTRALRAKTAYVDQDAALDPEMTGGETLRFFCALHGAAPTTLGELAARFGIVEILSRPVATWSGGQKRRLHIACALLHSPEVMFLDEPTAGLDGGGARFLWDELDRRTQAGATALLVGHDLEEIEREAAMVIMLDRGKVIATGSPAALVAANQTTWLRLTLRQPPGDATALLHTVEALSGFSRARLDGRRLWVQADDFEPRRVGDLLAAIALEIADVRVLRQDLASVYRTLTGGELSAEPRKRGRR